MEASAFTSLFLPCRLKGNYPKVLGRAAALENDEDWDFGDDAQEEECSHAEEAGHQDTSAGEGGEEHMVYLQRQSTCINRMIIGVSDVGLPTT